MNQKRFWEAYDDRGIEALNPRLMNGIKDTTRELSNKQAIGMYDTTTEVNWKVTIALPSQKSDENLQH